MVALLSPWPTCLLASAAPWPSLAAGASPGAELTAKQSWLVRYLEEKPQVGARERAFSEATPSQLSPERRLRAREGWPFLLPHCSHQAMPTRRQNDNSSCGCLITPGRGPGGAVRIPKGQGQGLIQFDKHPRVPGKVCSTYRKLGNSKLNPEPPMPHKAGCSCE